MQNNSYGEIDRYGGKIRDYVAKELNHVQNTLAKDYELHFTKYQELFFSTMDLKSSIESEKRVIQHHDAKIQETHKLIEELSKEKEDRDFFLVQQARRDQELRDKFNHQ